MAGVLWENWLNFVTDGIWGTRKKTSRMNHTFLVFAAQWSWQKKADGDNTFSLGHDKFRYLPRLAIHGALDILTYALEAQN